MNSNRCFTSYGIRAWEQMTSWKKLEHLTNMPASRNMHCTIYRCLTLRCMLLFFNGAVLMKCFWRKLHSGKSIKINAGHIFFFYSRRRRPIIQAVAASKAAHHPRWTWEHADKVMKQRSGILWGLMTSHHFVRCLLWSHSDCFLEGNGICLNCSFLNYWVKSNKK